MCISVYCVSQWTASLASVEWSIRADSQYKGSHFIISTREVDEIYIMTHIFLSHETLLLNASEENVIHSNILSYSDTKHI